MKDLTTPRRFLGLASNCLMPAAQTRKEEEQLSKEFKRLRSDKAKDWSWCSDASPLAEPLKEQLGLAEQRRLRKVERSSDVHNPSQTCGAHSSSPSRRCFSA